MNLIDWLGLEPQKPDEDHQKYQLEQQIEYEYAYQQDGSSPVTAIEPIVVLQPRRSRQARQLSTGYKPDWMVRA